MQGVGFRPYVHRLAAAGALRGFVRNDASGVLIDVEGEKDRVDEFCRQLMQAPPTLATIARLEVEEAPLFSYSSFEITPSDARTSSRAPVRVPPDVGTCESCLAELFDRSNRRFGHPFITCTDCGPRFTVLREAPYDRERTTMSTFPLCVECQREYDDPRDRRFHAETIACPKCGPTLRAQKTADDAGVRGVEAVRVAAEHLRDGGIVAIKALGGFHLACDATNAASVRRLRERKRRQGKPFAIMVRDVNAAAEIAILSELERAVLVSSDRPVVLLTKRPETGVSDPVAPKSATFGVMLPSTPIHHLLLAELDRPLVMTSGNSNGDPVEIDDVSAFAALGDIADLFLTHDRPIAARCDDSVVRVIADEVRPLRRSRGAAPRWIDLPRPVNGALLAVGGHLKNTVCVAAGNGALLSAHIGDLETEGSRIAMEVAIESTLRLAGVRPTAIAHDLHPDYASTHVADTFARRHGVERLFAVQHHHAHVAACLAEVRHDAPVIGVVFDGAGLGSDGAIWGGEFLVVDRARFTRAGHLSYVALPGGDAAARHPWRSAAAHAAAANPAGWRPDRDRPAGVDDTEWTLVRQILARPQLAPRTSSVGRLFDAVSSLVDLCHANRFEGEAAMALEAAAEGRVIARYPVTLSGGTAWTASSGHIIGGVLEDLAAGRNRADIAAAFHGALRDLIVLGCERVREETGHRTVVLTGGVFANRLLTESAYSALTARRFKVLLPRLVPCNDGGLALGQAYVAACTLEAASCA